MKKDQRKRPETISKSPEKSREKPFDKGDPIPRDRQIGEIAFLNEEGETVFRTTRGLQAKAVIREALFRIIEETGVIPTIKDLREITGYTAKTINRYLGELDPDINDEYKKTLYPLTGEILKTIGRRARAGDMKAAELWLAFVHNFKVSEVSQAENKDDGPGEYIEIGGKRIDV